MARPEAALPGAQRIRGPCGGRGRPTPVLLHLVHVQARKPCQRRVQAWIPPVSLPHGPPIDPGPVRWLREERLAPWRPDGPLHPPRVGVLLPPAEDHHRRQVDRRGIPCAR